MSLKLVTEPRVYLVGRQSIDDDALSRFLSDEGVSRWETDTDVAGEKLIEAAGRVCYMSFAKPRPGGNAAYIGHILEVGHGSVLEHEVFNFILTGVSRSFTHELVRHRAGFGYSQLSQRYVDEKDTEFVVPPALRAEVEAARGWLEESGCSAYEWFIDWNAPDSGDVPPTPDDPGLFAGLKWLASVEIAKEMYRNLADYLTGRVPGHASAPGSAVPTDRRKAAREAARSVLPNATETKVFVTANGRALRHFLEMRGGKAADAEIRRVATEMLRVLRAESPNLFGDYSVGEDGIQTPYRKV